jgi:hypothetical protein
MTVHVIARDGAFTFWTAADTPRDTLIERLTRIDLEKFCPPERTNTAALQIALNEYKANTRRQMRSAAKHGEKSKLDVAVQGLADRQTNGFEVVGIERGDDSNGYTGRFSAKVTLEGQVEITRGYLDWDERASLQRMYETAKATLGAEALGPALTEIAKSLGATTVREAGGVYYLPNAGVARWEEVIQAFQSAGASKVYCAKVVMDAETVRAVKDAIISEVTESATVLANEIAGGDLGEIALQNRVAKARVLHGRVNEYSAILNDTLKHLHDIVNVAEVAASSALSMQQDNSQFAGMYG